MTALAGLHETVLVAPGGFGGTLSAVVVAEAIAAGLESEGVPVDRCPLADGGEGTLAALAPAFGCRPVEAVVHDPRGTEVVACFGLGADARGRPAAVLEAVAPVAPGERDARGASTYGTGELIAAAASAGARTIYIAAGGCAATDGGAGALEAIDAAGGLGGAHLVALCDVRARFLEAADAFASQKGADPDHVLALTRRLDALADRLPRDPRGVAMTGAAGGLSGALWAALGAELEPGAPAVLGMLRFEARMLAARAVITGAGRIDHQSLAGSLVSEIATRARQAGVPCHAVVGRRELDAFGARVLDLQVIAEAGTPDALRAAGRALAEVVSLTSAQRSRAG